MGELIGAVCPGTVEEVLSRIRKCERYTADNDRHRAAPGRPVAVDARARVAPTRCSSYRVLAEREDRRA